MLTLTDSLEVESWRIDRFVTKFENPQRLVTAYLAIECFYQNKI